MTNKLGNKMNKNYYKSLVAAAIITSFSHTAMADTLAPIVADQDTWTNGSGAGSGSNYGTQTTLRIDTGKMRAFIQFTVAGIPEGHSIDSAILTLTAQGNKSGNIPDTFIAPVINAPQWDQATLTDLTDDDLIAATGDTIATATDIAVGSTADFDIAASIDGNGTYTFMINISDADARATKYYSSEASESFRPSLNITTIASAPSDTTKPVFETDIPAIEVNATGTKTDISSLVNITATDETDGELVATIIGDSSLISGAHTVTLQATDAAGNKETQDVTVNIKPLILLTAPEILSLPSGSSTSATIALSGPAVTYPATVDYTITGDAATTDSGTLTFNDTSAQNIEITLLNNALNDQTAILALTETSNVQENNETVTIAAIEGNAAPSIGLTLTQAGVAIANISSSNAEQIPYIDATNGDVTVTINIDDFNTADTHDVAWSNTAESLGATEVEGGLVFSPAALSGDFALTVSATESNTTEKFSAQLSAQIRIIKDGLPELIDDKDSDGDGINDIDEGFKDSDGDGIVDYLDDNADTTQLPLSADQKSLQTLDGLTLSLGSVSTKAQGIAAKSAIITQEELASTVTDGSADTNDSGFLPMDGVSIFNFTVSGLASNGDTAPIVYPLPKDVVIGEETEYRKYTQLAGWTTFVSDADNKIASAAKDETGNCPAPNDALYIEGLTAGDSCIQLTIKDGGIYDADGIENSSIEDPGVLAESFEIIQWSTDTIVLPATNVNEGSTVTLQENLTAYLGSVDVSAVTFGLEGDSSWLTVEETGAITANVSNLATGEHTAVVSFSDNKTQTGEATVSVSVTYNEAPKLAEVELVSASRNEAYLASITDSISDAESDTYTVEKVSGPYWLKVSETGELSGTPLKANIGDNNITVKLTDSKGATSQTSFNVPVVDSETRSSNGGSFSAGLLSLLALLSLRRRKAQK